MDKAAAQARVEQIYRLLALCARAEGHPLFFARLKRASDEFTGWDELPAQAELHGMAALLWHHLQQAGISIPEATAHTLKLLRLRQRRVTEAHARLLGTMLPILEKTGIKPLLLKGLGLAYQYYPDPSVRAVNDIDLLLRQWEVLPALRALAEAGFQVDRSLETRAGPPPEEVFATSPAKDGVSTQVEIHHYGSGKPGIFGDRRQEELLGLDSSPRPLKIERVRAYVPAPADALLYLSRHTQRHLIESSEDRPLPLKWMADIVSLVERHAKELDWPELEKRDPALIQRLNVFYSLTLLPERLAGIIPIEAGEPPRGLNRYPRGWPGHSYRGLGGLDLVRIALRTFDRPSDWWLRLYNGIGDGACWWYGVVVHPLQVIQLALRAVIRRLRRR